MQLVGVPWISISCRPTPPPQQLLGRNLSSPTSGCHHPAKTVDASLLLAPLYHSAGTATPHLILCALTTIYCATTSVLAALRTSVGHHVANLHVPNAHSVPAHSSAGQLILQWHATLPVAPPTASSHSSIPAATIASPTSVWPPRPFRLCCTPLCVAACNTCLVEPSFSSRGANNARAPFPSLVAPSMLP